MKKLTCVLALAGVMIPASAYAQDAYNDGDGEYVASAQNKAGLRVEGRVFYERIGDPEDDIIYELGDAVGFGGEIGYDVAVGENIVVGPYFNYDISTVEACDLDLCLSSDGFWAAGLHIGFTSGESGLIYGKLGYSQQSLTLEGPFVEPGTDIVFELDENDKGGGYNFAFGYEQGFGPNAYGRLEVSVSENYDLYDFDFQRTAIGASIGARF